MALAQKTPHVNSCGLAVEFVHAEALSVCLWAGLGALAAAIAHVCFRDHHFGVILSARADKTTQSFDAPLSYLPFGVSVAIAVTLIVALRLPRVIWRGLKSWWLGVTSGLRLFSFALTFCALTIPWHNGYLRLLLYGISFLVFVVITAGHYVRAKAAGKIIPTEREVQVPVEIKEIAHTGIPDSDDPIHDWTEDTLDRSSIVDVLTTKLLIAKAPVIALFGEYGSGKTSVLNLLRAHLRGKAIVVTFSTWLPGSQETLTAYLLSDISAQCQKEFVVPGLRRSARRVTDALSETVPVLKGLIRLFPAITQKDEIESLRNALARLPKRIVVLLDELDRMERAELLQLLKVVRGMASLPNLSFVCAAARTKLTKTVFDVSDDEGNLFFEKFFPTSVPIPRLDTDMLRNAGVERLVGVFRRRNWFADDREETEFRKELEEMWNRRIAPWVRNLRGLGLLANDVSVAAAPLRREVDPIDLILIELLQRFKPEVYDIVARNNTSLTGGGSFVRSGNYYFRDELKRIHERLNTDLSKASESEAQAEQIKGILGEMFPDYAKREGLSWDMRPKRSSNGKEDRRINNPSMFLVYFRHQLPSAIFSSLAMETLAEKSRNAKLPEERRQLFSTELLAMEPGSLKRDDFLRKAVDELSRLNAEIGRAWVEATLAHADTLTYDMMAQFGEAGHVLRMIHRVALELPGSQRVDFLEDCILRSVDDSLPERIFRLLPKQQDEGDLQIQYSHLYPAFLQRMNSRYGKEVDAARVDLSRSDPRAFHLWSPSEKNPYGVRIDPEEREIQHDFWRRYIGTDRTRLLRVFDAFLLPNWIIEVPTELFVEETMSVADLRRLAETLPKSADPDKDTKRAEWKLTKFLRGDYANGVSMGGVEDTYRDVHTEEDAFED